MFGQYREDLGEYARLEAYRLKALEKHRKKEKLRQKELKPYRNAIHRKLVGNIPLAFKTFLNVFAYFCYFHSLLCIQWHNYNPPLPSHKIAPSPVTQANFFDWKAYLFIT